MGLFDKEKMTAEEKKKFKENGGKKDYKEYLKILKELANEGIEITNMDNVQWFIKFNEEYERLNSALNEIELNEEQIKILESEFPTYLSAFKKYITARTYEEYPQIETDLKNYLLNGKIEQSFIDYVKLPHYLKQKNSLERINNLKIEENRQINQTIYKGLQEREEANTKAVNSYFANTVSDYNKMREYYRQQDEPEGRGRH